jgi:hypothetical protein
MLLFTVDHSDYMLCLIGLWGTNCAFVCKMDGHLCVLMRRIGVNGMKGRVGTIQIVHVVKAILH